MIYEDIGDIVNTLTYLCYINFFIYSNKRVENESSV